MRQSKKDILKKSLERHSKNSYLLNAREELSKKWLNQRKMNTQKRVAERNRLLDSGTIVPDASDTPDEDFLKGMMYFFRYDAKTKKKLPYFDEYPLILPFAYKDKLMYGLNVHYMPPKIRAVVLDMLWESRAGGNLSATPQQIVKALSENKYFKPAIHSYYPDHIVSNVTEIPTSEWENVIFLPLAKFVSYTKNPHSQQQVYADYMRRM